MPSTAGIQYILNLRADALEEMKTCSILYTGEATTDGWQVADDEYEVKIGREPHRFTTTLKG